MAEYTPNGLLIKQLHDRLEKYANNDLRSRDLTMMQVSVLQVLKLAEGQKMTMKELEHYFQIAQSTVVGIVSRLEKKELVEAFGDSSDKRIKVVHITPSGEACCKEASAHMEDVEEHLLSGLSQEEKNTLNNLLTKLLNNIS